MKKIYTLIFISTLFFLISCNPSVKEDSSKSNIINLDLEKDAVKVVLDKYRLVNETENIELAKEIWSNSDQIVVFGTASNEKLIGWNAIKNALNNQFAELDEILISVRDQYVQVNSTANTAWFSEIMNYNYVQNGEAKSFEGVRFSGVMEKVNQEWRIIQSHISIAGDAK